MGGNPYDDDLKPEPYPKRIYNADGKIVSIILDKDETMWSEISYDENGNEVLKHTSDKYWQRKEYDENNHLTYYYNSNGIWYQYDYDEYDRLISYKHSNGAYIDIKYTTMGMVEYKDSSSVWYKHHPGILYEDYNGNYWDCHMGIDNPYPSITLFVKEAITYVINNIEQCELILSMTEELNNRNKTSDINNNYLWLL